MVWLVRHLVVKRLGKKKNKFGGLVIKFHNLTYHIIVIEFLHVLQLSPLTGINRGGQEGVKGDKRGLGG